MGNLCEPIAVTLRGKKADNLLISAWTDFLSQKPVFSRSHRLILINYCNFMRTIKRSATRWNNRCFKIYGRNLRPFNTWHVLVYRTRNSITPAVNNNANNPIESGKRQKWFNSFNLSLSDIASNTPKGSPHWLAARRGFCISLNNSIFSRAPLVWQRSTANKRTRSAALVHFTLLLLARRTGVCSPTTQVQAVTHKNPDCVNSSPPI